MINEDMANKTLHLNIRAGKHIARLTLKAMKKILLDAKKYGGLEKLVKSKGSEVKLKDMVKKGQLEDVVVTDRELKDLKKELNKHGVKFSVMKDKETGNHSVFFQAKDLIVMDKAFKNTISKLEKRENRKESVKDNINKFKEVVKNTVTKDKIKNKHKEQSL